MCTLQHCKHLFVFVERNLQQYFTHKPINWKKQKRATTSKKLFLLFYAKNMEFNQKQIRRWASQLKNVLSDHKDKNIKTVSTTRKRTWNKKKFYARK